MSPAQALQQALDLQDAIVAQQTPPGATRCCGALDLCDSAHGGRPFQCLCQLELFRSERTP